MVFRILLEAWITKDEELSACDTNEGDVAWHGCRTQDLS